ncbi:MAG: hypothetical protein ABEK12_00380 [Candidatus Nanohaloarchaea archaeon]
MTGAQGGTPTGAASLGTPVHWHADYRITVCGQDRVLADGPLLAHTHGEHTFHMEGTRTRREQATLDWIVDELGGDLSSDSILGYEEPESCPGSDGPGTLTITANGRKFQDPADYIVQDGDRIVIRYR